MKLEYRDLSSSRSESTKRFRVSSLGFLDFFAASLLLFVVSLYLILPHHLDRVVDLLVYEPANNSYASMGCVVDRTTRYQFTRTREVPELKETVRVIHHADLGRYARPRPDPDCFAAKGFVESVPRFEYFFGWLIKAVS